jgi:hypothetical protein
VVATDEPGEEEVARVAASKRCVLAAAAEDRLRHLEQLLVDQRFVQAGVGVAVPADEAAVGGVGEDQLERVRRPALLPWRRRAFGVEHARDRGGAELALGVQVKDPADDRRLDRVRDQELALRAARVAVGRAAAHPAAFADAPLEAGGDAVDDRCVFELGEDAEHLQHHPAGGRASVERLGRRLEHNLELVELVAEPGELAHLARESVDAVDEQQIEAALARERERLLQARPVECRRARLILDGSDHAPVLHRLAVALEPLPLCPERGRLVVLVGRDPHVQAYPLHRDTSSRCRSGASGRCM